MKDNLRERYGPYPKRRERRRQAAQESHFLKKCYDWLKWKVEKTGEIAVYRPCLQS